MELTLTARGQVTFNKGLLAHLGVRPGGKISVTPAPGGKLEIGAAARKLTIDEFRQIAEEESARVDTGVRATIDDIQEAIAQGYARHGMRGLK